MPGVDLSLIEQRPEVHELSLLSSTAAISAFTVLARVAGAGKTALITLFFRPGDGLDTYLLAFLIPSFLADVFVGALNPVLIPALVEACAVKGHAEAAALYGEALYRCVSGAIALALLAGCGALWLGTPGVNTGVAGTALFQQMLLIMIPVLPMSAVAGVWRSVLNAELRYGAASFSWLLTPLVASLVLGLARAQGVISLAIGSAAGQLAEVIFLAGALRHAGIPLAPARRPLETGLAPLRMEYGAMVAVNLVTKGAVAIDQAAAAMSGAGGLSVFNLSTRLPGMVLAVGPEAFGTALLPRFSQLIARKTGREARRFLLQVLGTAVILMTLVSGILMWLSEPVVKLAFGHGALSGEDIRRVTEAQRWALMQVPFSVGLAILTRFVASLRANRSILPIWVAALAAHAVFSYFVAKRFGVAGILCLSAAVEALALAAFLYRVFRQQPEPCLTRGPVG